MNRLMLVVMKYKIECLQVMVKNIQSALYQEQAILMKG